MLNLLALLTFLLALAAVVVRTGRRMPRDGARDDAGGIACVACGAPAAGLTSFTCPSCHVDVREAGLAGHAKRGAAGPLWNLMSWTMVVIVASLVVTTFIGMRLSVNRQEFEIRHSSAVQSGPVGFTMSMHGRGSAVENETESGELVADLSVKPGGFASLEVEGPPLRGRLLDASGAPVGAEAPLDVPLALRWFEAAGADPETPLADHQARAALEQIATNLRVPLEVPRSDKPRPELDSSASGGGSSRSGRRVPPDWLNPTAVVFWSALWLTGAFYLTRRQRSVAEAPAAIGEDPAAPTRPGGGPA